VRFPITTRCLLNDAALGREYQLHNRLMTMMDVVQQITGVFQLCKYGTCFGSANVCPSHVGSESIPRIKIGFEDWGVDQSLRLARSEEHCAAPVGPFRDNVCAMVNAVDEIDIQYAARVEHCFVALGAAR